MGPTRPCAEPRTVERVQVGVRLERRLVKVLKALAEFEGVTLGQLLEKIVLHSFEAVPGQEGEACASPHSRAALAAIGDLNRIYGLHDIHRSWRLAETPDDAPEPPARPAE